MSAIARKPRADPDGLSPIILTKRCTDPPMPHELRYQWAERMRRHEAAQGEAPADSGADAGSTP